MKNYFALLFAFIILFSCKKGDLKNIEIEKVWVDPNIKLKEFKDAISSNKTGWEFVITYGDNKTMTYGYLGFNEENTSDFLSDFSKNYSSYGKTNYKIEIVQSNPSLNFSKTSRFSNFAMDAKKVDTLFTYKGLKSDTILLEGELHGSIMKMTKCSSDKLAKLKENSINSDYEKLKKLAEMPKYFFHFHTKDKSMGIEIDTTKRVFTFISGSGEKPIYTSSKYYFNGNGISLENQLEIDGTKIHLLEGLQSGLSELNFTGNLKISNEKSPRIYDLKSVKDFVGNEKSNLWWLSERVFEQRNNPDLAGFTKIPGFLDFNLAPYYDFQAEYNTYYWLIVLNINGTNPGNQQGPVSIINNNGTLRFIQFLEGPPSSMPEIVKGMKITNSYIYNPIGFYVMRTGIGYTLVDARDGLTWAYFQAPIQ